MQIFATKKHRILQLQIFATKTSFLQIFATKTFFLQILQQKTVVFYNCMKTSIHGATVISDDLGAHASIGP